MNNSVDLEKISLTSKFILLDNSAILGTYECNSNNIEGKINYSLMPITYFITEMGRIDNLVLTERIKSELGNFSFLSQKSKKEYPRNELGVAIIEENFQKSKQELLESISSEGKILQFSRKESERYNELNSKYHERQRRYYLSEEDYDLAICALTIARQGEKVAIISNDGGIKNICSMFTKSEYFGKNIKFFNHVSIGRFKLARIDYDGRDKI